MDGLTLFGFAAVSLMLLFYAFEDVSAWCVLGFAVACALASAYAFLQGSLPFALVEGIWTFIALKRWQKRRLTGSADRRTAGSTTGSTTGRTTGKT